VGPDNRNADKPGGKGKSGGHARAFASRGKVQAAKMMRTAPSSKKGGGDAHVCQGNGILLTEKK
jgi:hypothetical protein